MSATRPCNMIQVLRLLRRPTHTHPAKAGLVQYASYTTKCPGTTSGLSGKQATHDGVQALPPVGKGPAHKMVIARPKERRNAFRWQASYTPCVQALSPPASQLRDKASRHCGNITNLKWNNSTTMKMCKFDWKARGPATFGLDSSRLSI